MVTHKEWAPVANYLLKHIGYEVSTGKYYLLHANLSKLLQGDIRSPADLCRAADRNRQIRQQLINGATINESYFFRDNSLWQVVQNRLLPELADSVSFCNELHVLVCACARGQEVYSLAMLLHEHPLFQNKIRSVITAVDIDTEVLDIARHGCYTELEASRGLDAERRGRFFHRNGVDWQIDNVLRRSIRFEQLNLTESFHFHRRFDLVFCRNVLIYFQPEKKAAIIDRLAQYTNNHGYLILGGAESTLGLGNSWNPRNFDGYTVYEKRY
jgi:chemotaxis protein methyltransferase CheR